jgi:hypothetical protein
MVIVLKPQDDAKEILGRIDEFLASIFLGLFSNNFYK